MCVCRYHKPFADSEFHCKHQVTVLTSGPVYLADILYNELALCYFMEVGTGDWSDGSPTA